MDIFERSETEMIDPMKWEKMTDEQKLQMCNAIKEGVNIRTVTKEDWKLMFDFLLVKKEIKQGCFIRHFICLRFKVSSRWVQGDFV